MRILKFIILSTLVFALASNAALPPLEQEDREAYSSNIITGTVVDMTVKAEKRGYQSVDNIYTVVIAPTSVEKGDDASSHVSFRFWRASMRPDGWCGPSGQYGMMKIGDTIRAYMYKNEDGSYELIEPNGFDKL